MRQVRGAVAPVAVVRRDVAAGVVRRNLDLEARMSFDGGGDDQMRAPVHRCAHFDPHPLTNAVQEPPRLIQNSSNAVQRGGRAVERPFAADHPQSFTVRRTVLRSGTPANLGEGNEKVARDGQNDKHLDSINAGGVSGKGGGANSDIKQKSKRRLISGRARLRSQGHASETLGNDEPGRDFARKLCAARLAATCDFSVVWL